MSLVVVVDKNNKEIGTKERLELTAADCFRASVLWLRNSKGQVLIQKRSKFVLHKPGTYGSSAGGTVDAGETYESTILRECKEEIGLSGIQPRVTIIRTYGGNCFTQWYELEMDVEIDSLVLDPNEVEEVRWVDLSWLHKEAQEHPEHFMPHLLNRALHPEVFGDV